jgi:GxxExxY protein
MTRVRAHGASLSYVAQQPIALTYKTLRLDAVYKVDLLVEEMVIVEVKCVEALAPVHKAQLLTLPCLRGSVLNVYFR